jgi:hypothetical protein
MGILKKCVNLLITIYRLRAQSRWAVVTTAMNVRALQSTITYGTAEVITDFSIKTLFKECV